MDINQAALISPGLRATIKQMSRRDNLSVEEISQALGVEQVLIQTVLDQGSDSSSSLTDGVEQQLGELCGKARTALENVLDYGESEFAKLRAAEIVLKGASGSFRPRTQINNTLNMGDMNVLIQQAVAAHARQIEAAKLKS